jgi:hypothetical protein
MIVVNKRRYELKRLIQEVRRESVKKNKKIDTIDPVLKIARNLYPMMSRDELLKNCITVLRIILSENNLLTQQTTLLTHT